MDRYLLVFFGGGAGALIRYLAGAAIAQRYGARFLPVGTLAINLTGSFLVGLIMILLTERFRPHPNWRLLLVGGVLGGYTTFSTFEYETYQAVRGGSYWLGVINIVASVAGGYLAVWLGTLLGKKI